MPTAEQTYERKMTRIPINLGNGRWMEVAAAVFGNTSATLDLIREWGRIPPGQPGSWSWHVLEYEDDPWAQAAVNRDPQGMGLVDISRYLGVRRQRIEQIMLSVGRKLRRERTSRIAARKLIELCRAMREEREHIRPRHRRGVWVSVTPHEDVPSEAAALENRRNGGIKNTRNINKVSEDVKAEILRRYRAGERSTHIGPEYGLSISYAAKLAKSQGAA